MPSAPPAPRSIRAARVAIALAALAAPAVHAVLATHQPAMPWVTALGLALGLAGGWLAPAWALAALVALAPLWQAAIGATTGDSDIQLVMPWLAAVAGCLAAAEPSRWRSGATWTVPVAAWGLVVAATWPVAVLRELDFTTYAFTGRGAGPATSAAALVTLAAECQLVALLFFDWLLGVDDTDHRRLWRWLTPAIGAACGLAVWQAAVDPALLSRPPWIGLGRAAGAFYDANATGALSALFGPLLASGVTLGTRQPPSWRRAAFWGLASLAAVLASGSRTSMAAWALTSIVTWLWVGRHSWRVTAAVVAATAALLTAASMLRAPDGEGQFGAAARLVATTRAALAAEGGLVRVLWYRDGYGPASTQIIAEHPVGGHRSGHLRRGGRRLQSARCRAHPAGRQRPELVAPPVGRTRPPRRAAGVCLFAAGPGGRLAHAAVAGAGLGPADPRPGVLSWVSPPVQHPIVQVLVAMLIAGCVRAVTPAEPSRWPPAARVYGPLAWLVAAACAAGLAVDGWTTFRPAYRAVRFRLPYVYGYGAEAATPLGTGRWAATRAVGVFPPPPDTVLVLRVTLPHTDLATRPVHVTIADRRGVVCAQEVHTAEPFECRVTAEPGQWMVAELAVDRPWDRDGAQERAAFVAARFEPER